jgi:DnaJ-class molecular chaperone
MKNYEGREKCRKCNGKGYLMVRENTITRCPRCLGRREVDWVEAIVGSKRDRGMPSADQLIRLYEIDNGGELKFIRKIVTYQIRDGIGEIYG